MLALVQGCSSFSPGAGGGTGHSPVEYVGNSLRVSDNLPLNLVVDAANVAVKKLLITVAVDKKKSGIVRLEGQDAKQQPVIVQLVGINHYTTEVQITVGTADSAENRAEERQIYDEMRTGY